MPDDLDARIRGIARALGNDSRVIFAYLFGGLARGRQTPLSDVDMAVYLRPDAVVAASKLALIGLLTRELSSDAIDLVILNETPVSLAGRIQQGARVLVDKEPSVRHQYESSIRRQFFDFRIREHAMLARRFGRDRH